MAEAGGGARLPGGGCTRVRLLSVLGTRPCALPPRQSHSTPHMHPYKEVCISLGNGWGRGVAQQMAGRLQVCLAKGRRSGILIGGP